LGRGRGPRKGEEKETIVGEGRKKTWGASANTVYLIRGSCGTHYAIQGTTSSEGRKLGERRRANKKKMGERGLTNRPQ